MQRTITPEYMCQVCDCRRILTVMRSSPVLSSRSSSLPKALMENGQVGSRNTWKTRGPCPPEKRVSAPCIHAIFPLPGSVRGQGPKRSRRRGS